MRVGCGVSPPPVRVCGQGACEGQVAGGTVVGFGTPGTSHPVHMLLLL